MRQCAAGCSYGWQCAAWQCGDVVVHLACLFCCSDEMGDFIVGNETVDKRRERRDARVAMAAGLSTDAVAVSMGYGQHLTCLASSLADGAP